MQLLKIRTILLAVVISLAVLVATFSVLGAAPALAQGSEPSSLAPYSQAQSDDDNWSFGVYFTDPVSIGISDLSGNLLGEGELVGEARCSGANCSQTTRLTYTGPYFTDTIVIEYNFSFLRSVNAEEEHVVVDGMGTINRLGQSERFSFRATFRNNGDGKIYARYDASLPEASVILPSTPGTFELLEMGGS